MTQIGGYRGVHSRGGGPHCSSLMGPHGRDTGGWVGKDGGEGEAGELYRKWLIWALTLSEMPSSSSVPHINESQLLDPQAHQVLGSRPWCFSREPALAAILGLLVWLGWFT